MNLHGYKFVSQNHSDVLESIRVSKEISLSDVESKLHGIGGKFLYTGLQLIFVPIALSVITFVGAMTAFFAATTGLLQNDLKRVIAYSTCSQLGYMIFNSGLSNYSVGVFHLA